MGDARSWPRLRLATRLGVGVALTIGGLLLAGAGDSQAAACAIALQLSGDGVAGTGVVAGPKEPVAVLQFVLHTLLHGHSEPEDHQLRPRRHTGGRAFPG
jgi:sugar (pentulose or hexulose) kinase